MNNNGGDDEFFDVIDMQDFEHRDSEFQKEVRKKNMEIAEKWNKEYSKKVYLGPSHVQAKARAHDNAERKSKTLAEQNESTRIREVKIFGKEGRAGVLKRLEGMDEAGQLKQQNREDKIKKFKNRHENLNTDFGKVSAQGKQQPEKSNKSEVKKKKEE